jgi:hypothetical protein
VYCGSGDNKRKDVLTFEVANFNIRYNCILRRPFLLKFMVVNHTAYATLKMPGPKGVITIKADKHDALACENAILTHVGQFGEKAVQEQVAKIVKTHGGRTSFKPPVPKPLTIYSPRSPSAKKGAYGASASNQHPADQSVDLKKKEAANKEVTADLSDPEKKFRVSTCLEPK